MKQTALLVFNPQSGKKQMTGEEVLEHIHLNLKDFEINKFEVSGDEVKSRLKDSMKQSRPNLILIAGGDGTVKLTAECLPEKIPMAILPTGSANGLAKCLGICSFEDGLEALRKLETMHMDAIQIGDELCLHLADFGSNANLINKFEEKGLRGMLGYIQSSLSEVFSLESRQFRLELPDETVDLEAIMLVIANGREYGTGATINSKGILDDGKFELISVEVKSSLEFMMLTKKMFTGEPLDESAVRTWSVENCRIMNLDQANFQIDGELRGKPDSIDVKIKAGAYEFVKKS